MLAAAVVYVFIADAAGEPSTAAAGLVAFEAHAAAMMPLAASVATSWGFDASREPPTHTAGPVRLNADATAVALFACAAGDDKEVNAEE